MESAAGGSDSIAAILAVIVAAGLVALAAVAPLGLGLRAALSALAVVALLAAGSAVRRRRMHAAAIASLRGEIASAAALATRYQGIIESAPTAMVKIDQDGRITLANAQAERLFGYPRSELLGQPIEMLVPERFRARHPDYRRQYLSSPTVRAMGVGRDLFGRRKDGSEFPVEIGLNPIHTASGVEVLSSIVDITERKRLEDRFRLVVESAPNAMVMVDGEGRMVLVNAQAERLFGYARAEMLGRPVEMLVPERFRALHPESRNRFFAAPAARAMGVGRDLFGRRKDGSEFPVEIGLNPIETEQGVLVLSAIVDITERKRAETAGRALEGAEAANRARGEFLAIVSHEIRTPMNGVIGMTGLLLDTALTPEQRRMAATIRSCADGLLGLLNDILDMSKIEAGRLEIESIPFSPAQVVNDVASIFAERARAKNLWLRPTISRLVPGAVQGDPGRLRQILVNLVGNAVKFTERGGVEIDLAAEREAGGVCLRFAVSDTGPGMTAEQQQRLFQPFGQGDRSTARRHGGTGLGLAISRRLCQLMGGDIACASAPGTGSEFRFHIRASEAAADAITADAELPTAVHLRGRVLIVDDNSVNLQIATAQVVKLGCYADVANDGREALAAIAAAPYDVVLMDCEMPVMDGFAAVAELRRNEAATPGSPRLPVIAMTANALLGYRERCLAAGMDDHLAKPVRVDRLAQVLARWLPARPPAPETAAAAAAVAEDAPLNDPAVLASLTADLGPGAPALGRAIAAFHAETPKLVAALLAAVAADDLVTTGHLAHRLKGSCLAMGAARLGQAAQIIERSAEQGDAATVRAAAAPLADLAARSLAAMPAAPTVGR